MSDFSNQKIFNSDSENISNFDIFRILKVIRKNIIPMLGVCVLCIGAMIWIALFTFTETYTARGSLLVNPKVVVSNDEFEESVISSNSLYLSTQLATTYQELLLSDSVMFLIMEDCELDMTAENLKSCISITQASGTGVIKLSATTPSSQLSKDIVDSMLVILPKFIDKTMGFGKIEVVDSPTELPVVNENNNIKIYPFLGLLIGVVISFIWAFFKDLFNNTVRSSNDIKKKVGTNLLATMPCKMSKKKVNKPYLVDSARASFEFVEACKLLRAKLESIVVNKGIKRIMITSTYQNEGKTTIAVNLAISLAQIGKNVVVLDADLRCPSISETLCVNTEGQNGLLQYLNKEESWKNVIKFVKSHGVFVVLSGGTSNNPSELLGGEEMEKFLTRLESEFDYIIIDTPPESVVADAMTLSSKVDAALIVIKQEYAEIDDINGVIDDINSDGPKVIGCVYNSVDKFIERKYGKRTKKYHERYSSYGIQ